jgi:lysophospholipase L1-like esterase
MRKRLLFLSLAFNILFIGGVILAICKIGSPRYLYYLIKHRGQGIAVLQEQRADLFKMLPAHKQRIVMLGNSITALCEWAELLDNPNIINRGIIGDGTDDILERLPEVADVEPEKIFLLIGVNDLMTYPTAYILMNYEVIVLSILKTCPKTKLYLESILPIHHDFRRAGMRNEDIMILNQGIQKLAQTHQLTYIDLHTPMKDSTNALQTRLSKDGIHLNAAGYQICKDTLKKYISE